MYQKQPYRQPCGKQRHHIVESECTFEEALAKALKERELIDQNDKKFNWRAR
jgi:hypothetical protein